MRGQEGEGGVFRDPPPPPPSFFFSTATLFCLQNDPIARSLVINGSRVLNDFIVGVNSNMEVPSETPDIMINIDHQKIQLESSDGLEAESLPSK